MSTRYLPIKIELTTPEGLYCNGCPFLHDILGDKTCLLLRDKVTPQAKNKCQSKLVPDFRVSDKKIMKSLHCNKEMIEQIYLTTELIEVKGNG